MAPGPSAPADARADETLADVRARMRARRPTHEVAEGVREKEVAHVPMAGREQADAYAAELVRRATDEGGCAVIIDVDGASDVNAVGPTDEEARSRTTAVTCYSNACALAALHAVAHGDDAGEDGDNPSAGVFGEAGPRLLVVLGAGALRASERALSVLPERAERMLKANGVSTEHSLAIGLGSAAAFAAGALLVARKRQCAVVVLWSANAVPAAATEAHARGAGPIDWLGRP